MKRNAVLTSTFTNIIDTYGTLWARAPKRAHPEPLKRIARGVALAIGISLSIGVAPADGGSKMPIKSIKQLADYQLTDKQYHCHNSIIYKESRFNANAVNGSHYGYYQGHSKYLWHKPADIQFYWYWHYVANRYGITQYDEPDMCKALHHLLSKGWQ